MAYSTFTNALTQAKRNSLLRQTPFSTRDTRNLFGSYMDTAGQRVAANRQAALADRSLQSQIDYWTDSLSNSRYISDLQRQSDWDIASAGWAIDKGISDATNAANMNIAAATNKANTDINNATIAANTNIANMQKDAADTASKNQLTGNIALGAGGLGGAYLLSDSKALSNAGKGALNLITGGGKTAPVTQQPVTAQQTVTQPPETVKPTGGDTPGTTPVTGGEGGGGLSGVPAATGPIGAFTPPDFTLGGTGLTYTGPGAQTVSPFAQPAHLSDAAKLYARPGGEAAAGSGMGGAQGAANVAGMVLAVQALREMAGGKGKPFQDKSWSERLFDRPMITTLAPGVMFSDDDLSRELYRLNSQISAPIDWAAGGALGMLGGRGLTGFWGGGLERDFTPYEMGGLQTGYDEVVARAEKEGRRVPTQEEYAAIMGKPARFNIDPLNQGYWSGDSDSVPTWVGPKTDEQAKADFGKLYGDRFEDRVKGGIEGPMGTQAAYYNPQTKQYEWGGQNTATDYFFGGKGI